MIAGINKIWYQHYGSIVSKGYSVNNTRVGLSFSTDWQLLNFSRDTAQFVSENKGVTYQHSVKYSNISPSAIDLDFVKKLHNKLIVVALELNNGSTVIIGVDNPLRVKFKYISGQNAFDAVGYTVEMTSISKSSFEVYVFQSSLEYINIKNGLLYNWYAATDVRGICSQGWRVPSKEDFETLITYLGGVLTEQIASGDNYSGINTDFKENDPEYWAVNDGTNIYELNFRAGGLLWGTISSMFFIGLKTTSTCHSSSLSLADNPIHFDVFDDSETCYLGNILAAPSRSIGRSIRVIRNTSNQDRTKGLYQGNDGKIYRTICYGGLEITADNIAETKYANGDSINLTTDLVAWVYLTTGACCAYNNDPNNV